jgi:hypothetical protein
MGTSLPKKEYQDYCVPPVWRVALRLWRLPDAVATVCVLLTRLHAEAEAQVKIDFTSDAPLRNCLDVGDQRVFREYDVVLAHPENGPIIQVKELRHQSSSALVMEADIAKRLNAHSVQ